MRLRSMQDNSPHAMGSGSCPSRCIRDVFPLERTGMLDPLPAGKVDPTFQPRPRGPKAETDLGAVLRQFYAAATAPQLPAARHPTRVPTAEDEEGGGEETAPSAAEGQLPALAPAAPAAIPSTPPMSVDEQPAPRTEGWFGTQAWRRDLVTRSTEPSIRAFQSTTPEAPGASRQPEPLPSAKPGSASGGQTTQSQRPAPEPLAAPSAARAAADGMAASSNTALEGQQRARPTVEPLAAPSAAASSSTVLEGQQRARPTLERTSKPGIADRSAPQQSENQAPPGKAAGRGEAAGSSSGPTQRARQQKTTRGASIGGPEGLSTTGRGFAGFAEGAPQAASRGAGDNAGKGGAKPLLRPGIGR
jgi:hypothetical protein